MSKWFPGNAPDYAAFSIDAAPDPATAAARLSAEGFQPVSDCPWAAV